jgi:hypothetical protein
LDKLNAPPAPHDPHDFAKRVAAFTRTQTGDDIPSIPIWELNELAHELLACIREQQATLAKVRALVEGELIGNVLVNFPDPDTTLKSYLDAILAKYALEGK